MLFDVWASVSRLRKHRNDEVPHIDWSRFGKKTREQINAEAAEEKKRLQLTGRFKSFRVHVNGSVYDVPIPEVRQIREKLGLSQAEFAERFHLSQRTLQLWEQRRAMPDMPARVLLKAIERAPDVVAQAAAEVRGEIEAGVLHRGPMRNATTGDSARESRR
jgi:DNA-binding transcriptional regulator YiaG